MDLHPTSSYVRWLQLQLEDIDSQLSKEQGNRKEDETGGKNDNRNRGSLRRLEEHDEQSQIKSSSDKTLKSTFLNSNQETNTRDSSSSQQQQLLHDEREIIQQQLNDAMDSLHGTSSAYASVMEFSTLSNFNYINTGDENVENDDLSSVDDNKQRSRRLKEQTVQQEIHNHNTNIQTYNNNHRKFSKYEWAIRREGREEEEELHNLPRRKMMQTEETTQAAKKYINEVEKKNERSSGTRHLLDVTGTSKDGTTPLIGSSWMAIEYYNGTNIVPIIPSNSKKITLSFEDDTFFGDLLGCNYYSGSTHHMTQSSFEVGSWFKTDAAHCPNDINNEGILSQEFYYVYEVFVEGSTIQYNILLDNNGRRSLQLMDGDGNLLASFVPDPSFIFDAGGLVQHEGNNEETVRRSTLSKSMMEPESIDYYKAPIEQNNNRGRRLQQTKKKGGMFNTYQTSPLHQGYGTHYATIWVGTPSQRKSVIIDTGSHFTAFPCRGCEGCGEEHHTDRYFDPEASTTFIALTCDQCHAAQCEVDRCVFSQTYTEGSSWHAYESIDKVFVGGRELSSALNPINNSFKTDFLFGCQVKETGLFVTQLADGIMGMSAHPSTLPRAMYDQGKLEHNMFSMCFRRELHVSKQGIVAGMLTLGGIDTSVDLSPMVFARNVASTGWFTVFVKNVYIREQGGQRAKADGPHQKLQKINVDLYQMNSGKGVIIDSGTTDTYLHESIAKPFERVWERVTGKPYTNDPVKIDKKDLLLLPTVLIQMQAYDEFSSQQKDQIDKIHGLAGDIDPVSPQDIIVAVPATHYMEYSASKETYTPRIYFTETRGGVIGANAMQGHNVLFDWENKRVGFAESSCEYQEESKTITDEGVMSVDCRLGPPSLSVSCSDSADLSRCERGAAPDTALNGLEIWTRIVQAPGTPQGQTCEEVSVEQNRVNGGGQMEVNCDGKGVCREVRNCVISCSNAIAHGAALANTALSPIGSCGAVAWSACTPACTQTKVESVLMNDGKCHEEKSNEVSRPCHVQACGRSDPCRVPFVIHAIIKIHRAVAAHWSKHAEEIFTDAFSNTMNDRRKKDPLFEPGDVVVLNAIPWRASDDTIFGTPEGEEEDEELGMQLVVETSIFNPNAELPPSRSGQPVPLATCHERDLQPLANVALSIHRKLAQPNFIDLVVERMVNDGDLGQTTVSPFYYTFELDKKARKGQVVTSWTIKTDIGSGSARTDFNSDLPMGVLMLSLLSITVYTIWSLRLCSSRKRTDEEGTERGQSRDSRRRGKYSRLGNRRRDDDTAMAIIDEERSFIDHDDRSVMTTNTEYTMNSTASSRDSSHSLGSLSTYLEKTSRR